MNALVILLIGVVAVVGMMLVLRLNAFIALITAAILVSLLSPGELGEKISRVADEFGRVAGNIGIVIALAAVIGKCLMDSGAADRIVRSFLRVLGERRAPVALMGSGFVLAVPVFFDTVFYLLVPLARSLWRRTHQNYILYVTAIGAGGAITHTLVPPTPGPLFIADRLGIDLGLMILIGALISVPTAAVGLVACSVINRLMPIAMRPYVGEEEQVPIPDSQLPPLWISILPVILPVILISANTVAKTMAEAQAARPAVVDITAAAGQSEPVGANGAEPVEPAAAASELAVPEQRFWGQAAQVTSLLGNPNMALLLSTAIAMFVLVRWRRLSLGELSQATETALMSGGVIILITAGGGAFGGMLRAAGIQDAVQGALGGGSPATGTVVLLSAFAVAAVIKFAQGSSTVSMITTAGMFAAMKIPTETLGFHPVYLATVIGSGSLVGQWMNDSGFWIFAKMSGLTEVETLKCWSILTALLGTTGMLFSLLFAWLMPLV